MELYAIEKLVDEAEQRGVTLSQVVLEAQAGQMETTQEAVFDGAAGMLREMRASCVLSQAKSPSGLSGGIAYRYSQSAMRGKLLSPVAAKAVERALAIAEQNACMGRIVAAPTAGSCGILPGVLLSVGELLDCGDQALTMALINAGGIGMVIAHRATLSGAEGGCQAECGSAAAMAASAAAELMGGTPAMCANAAAFAFKAVLGLTCDPVCGLVEVPCVKRNASGAVNAITSAELALCGIESAIPVDQVIDAMRQVGSLMHLGLRETSQCGLAATPCALALQRRLDEE